MLGEKVRGARTTGGREVEAQRRTKDDEPLALWADLVRPIPGTDVTPPPHECAGMKVDFDIKDQPEYYLPGERIPEQQRFQQMEMQVWTWISDLGRWYIIDTVPLDSPTQHVERKYDWFLWGPGRYRIGAVVKDLAGNQDAVSEDSPLWPGGATFTVERCRASADEEFWCWERRCEGEECALHFTCGEPWGCYRPVCVGAGMCESDTSECHGGEQENPDQPPDHNPDIADENDFFSNDLPRWADVTNEDASSPVGVLAAASYPAVFGLLAEFGQGARVKAS